MRLTTPADLAFVLAAESAPDNRPFIKQWTWQEHEAALQQRDWLHMIIEREADATAMGYTILAGLANPNRSIELRRLVLLDKGKGYGRQVLRMLKQRAFLEWGAHRLWLDVVENNIRARALYESEGFVIDGILRECLQTADGFESLVIMSMLRDEYMPPAPPTDL